MQETRFKEIVAPSAKELFVSRIEYAILSGSLAIGELLPTTRDLAEQMKISCSVVNSGINELIRKGFLEVIPRKGVFVTDYAVNGNVETMAAIMNYCGEKINNRVYLSILETRRALEVPAVQKVARCRTEQQLSELKRIVAEMRQTCDCQKAAQLLFKFHHSICLLSENVIYPLIFKSFSPSLLVLWERYCCGRGVPLTCQTLDELVGYIEARDSDKAGQVIHRAITEEIELVEAQMGYACSDTRT